MQLDFPFTSARLKSLRSGTLAVPEAAALFRIAGPGALACLQGLLTCDLATPADDALHYGALLTPKGMIVVDPWVFHAGEQFLLVVPAAAREVTSQLLGRVLPPRLARTTELTTWQVAWLLGTCGLERFARSSGLPAPAAGRVVKAPDDSGVLLGGGSPQAPMQGLLVGPAESVTRLLQHAGLERADAGALAAARVLTGWPALGREIDERTLPQEVRYDELGAVSYVKGCYTGQETVARVHFRGHVNRMLRGLRIAGGEPLADRTLKGNNGEVGTVRTALLLEDRTLALGVLRRELEVGTRLRAGEREATVVSLPFEAV